MREWLNRAVSKTVVPARVPWVRIPPSPPAVSPMSFTPGEVQERLNWQHWKCCVRETVPWVRIPPSPPLNSCEQV